MQATFLGHGLKADTHNVGKQIAKSFDCGHFDCFYGFVAYAASTGLDKILSSLETAKKTFTRLTFYIGVDNKGTSKEALELLLQKEIETYIFHRDEEYITYHPKLFLFEGDKFTRVIIGSSNLTSSGFKTNVEASIQLDFKTKTDKQGVKLVNQIKEQYKELIDFSDPHIYKLTSELIEVLHSKDLLYQQFYTGSKAEETQPTDGEGQKKKTIRTKVPDVDFSSGFEPQDKPRYDYSLKVTRSDYDNFEPFLQRYIIYKRDIRPSGVVTKTTEDTELLRWYLRIKELIRNEILPEEFLKRLIEVDFPIGDGWEKTRVMIWDRRFNELIAYKNKFNKESKVTHVPQFKDRNHPYYKLGSWCAQQKQRRKGNQPPIWTEYEEEKMRSINFLWEVPNLGSGPDDEGWYERLLELEGYYSRKENYKTIPSQHTKLGRWLNEQVTLKLTGSRQKVKTFLHPIREHLLGELLSKNGVEWEWQKQKEREAIEQLAIDYTFYKNPDNLNLLTPVERKRYHERVSQAKYRSKKWEDWKREILLNVGMELPSKIVENPIDDMPATSGLASVGQDE